MSDFFDDIISEVSPQPQTNTLGPSEIPQTPQVEKVFTVAEFSMVLKEILEGTFKKIKIKGEIQGLKKHSSGTYYFDLKESYGGKDYILNCVLWKWTKIDVKLEEGLEVVLTGKVTAYTGRSSYQITVENVEVAGIGALLKLIEERKQKLSAEGLFDEKYKKTIPLFPQTIGVVTSPTGAVIQDIIHRITDRCPTRIIVYPVAVQGEGADVQITEAINNFNKIQGINRPDVIIVARGGGSVQDLMPFNEENVVRAVFASTIPVISAVGHETDTTLIDYVSDLRAPTPTGAAEKAVPVRSDLLRNIKEKENFLNTTIFRMFETFGLKIKGLSSAIKNPKDFIIDAIQRLDDKSSKFDLLISSKIDSLSEKINFASKMLESYSFKNVLKRGYSIVWNGSELISDKNDLQKLSTATIEFANGKVDIFTTPTTTPKQKKDKKEAPQNLQGNLF
ncbi:MAG: exodeoxyribonuclease VII large subunit [bacterium]|nr:exodeoxyribonuclease VII large subunit [bacterium]